MFLLVFHTTSLSCTVSETFTSITIAYWVRSCFRSLKFAPYDRSYTSCYSSSIASFTRQSNNLWKITIFHTSFLHNNNHLGKIVANIFVLFFFHNRAQPGPCSIRCGIDILQLEGHSVERIFFTSNKGLPTAQ